MDSEMMTMPMTMERTGFILPNSRVTRSWKQTMVRGLAIV